MKLCNKTVKNKKKEIMQKNTSSILNKFSLF